MRTKTTTREQTWNTLLKAFLREHGWDDLVKRVHYDHVITDARELTDEPDRVKIISEYLKNRWRS
jgi:hypothetical protein